MSRPCVLTVASASRGGEASEGQLRLRNNRLMHFSEVLVGAGKKVLRRSTTRAQAALEEAIQPVRLS